MSLAADENGGRDLRTGTNGRLIAVVSVAETDDETVIDSVFEQASAVRAYRRYCC